VAGIEDDGADGARVADLPGAHDRLDDFRHIHGGDEDVLPFLDNGEAQDVFHIVDENFAGPGAAADAFRGAGEDEGLVVPDGRVEFVKARDIPDRDIAPAAVEDDIPRGRRGSGRENNDEDQGGQGAHDA